MTAVHDEQTQVVSCAGFVQITPLLLEHGIVFLGDGYHPMKLTFDADKNGNIKSFEMWRIEPESEKVKRYYFHQVGKPYDPPKPEIIGVPTKFIMPEQ